MQRSDERPVGIEDCAVFPLFTDELLDLMRRHIPRDRWTSVGRALLFSARKAMADGPRLAAPPRADAMGDFGDASFEEGVLLKIWNLLEPLVKGQVLEVRSMDSGVREDLPDWCRMTGQEYLGASGPSHFVRKR